MALRKLILASASPRRRQLLQQIGWEFSVCPGNFQETENKDPQISVLTNALGKARSVAEEFPQGLILGADTIVACGNRLLGKPRDIDEAREMLQLLADNWHDVYTGLALVDGNGFRSVSDVVRTRVHMRRLTPAEREIYLKSAEPYDKAGAYGIQGRAAIFIDKIDGCYFNVVGLPLSKLAELRQLADEWR